MTADPQGAAGAPRQGDRRGQDRRRTDRRTPVPPWRSPWALVAYGVLGALALMLLFNGFGDDDPEPILDPALRDTPAAPNVNPVAASAGDPVQDAFGAAEFERLVIEGPTAVGQRVRTELFCDAPAPLTLRDAEQVEAAVATLVDAEGRVRGAECKWGRRGDERREDFTLLVPPDMAEQFAAAPLVSDGFVERRRLQAVVEWVGRSEALSLRTVGVLRALPPAA